MYLSNSPIFLFEDSLPWQTIALYHNHHLLSQHQLKKEHNCSIATHDAQLSVSIWASEMSMGIVMVLQVVQLQDYHQNVSLHVLDQIMKLMSMLLLSLYLPL